MAGTGALRTALLVWCACWPVSAVWTGFESHGVTRSPLEKRCPYIKTYYRCDSDEYNAFFLAQKALETDLLRVPKKAHILFYGPSYLGQLLIAILCNNSPPISATTYDCTNDPTNPLAAESRNLSAREAISGGYAFTLGLKNGAKVTGVINCEFAQDLSNPPLMYRSMKALTQQAGRFTHSAWMKPHPPCFFEFKRRQRRGLPGFPCVNVLSTEEDGSGAAPDEQKNFDRMNCTHLLQLKRAIRGHGKHMLAQVVSWRDTEVKDVPPETKCHPNFVGPLLLGPALKEKDAVCNHDDGCRRHLTDRDTGIRRLMRKGKKESQELRPLGHQCMPGGVEYLAMDTLEKLGLTSSGQGHNDP